MKLRELPCKTWSELIEFVQSNQLPLLLSTEDKRCVIAAKNCKEYGPECASAIICAELYKDKNRAVSCAHWALEAYRELCPDRKDEWDALRNWIAWAGMPNIVLDNVWPIKPEFDSNDKKAGMANVMFRLAMEDLFNGTTSDKLAAMKIFEFLNEGMKKKEKGNEADSTGADE